MMSAMASLALAAEEPMLNAELQLSKVRMLAERRAKHQSIADSYLQDMKAARDNYVFWLAQVKLDDEQMREYAARQEP